LESIEIPNGVTEIGAAAFQECSSLRQVVLPNSVSKICKQAFRDCTSLESIEIPNSVTKIGEGVFSYCTVLERIILSSENKYFKFDNGTLLSKSCTRLLTVLKKNELKEYVVPTRVNKIDSWVFTGNKTLESIIISENVQELGSPAFCGANQLREIFVSNNNKYFSSEDGILFSKDRQVLERIPIGKNLTEYNTPEEVIEIGAHALCGCSTLQKINIPKTVRKIKTCAFDKLEELKELHIQIIDIEKCEIHEEMFNRSKIFDSCTLYVPSGTRWEYRHHPVFGKFKNIEIEVRK
jgi:hypothetical protein